MELSKKSLVVRFAFWDISDKKIPEQISLCLLFWKTILGALMGGVFFCVVVPVLFVAGSVIAAIVFLVRGILFLQIPLTLKWWNMMSASSEKKCFTETPFWWKYTWKSIGLFVLVPMIIMVVLFEISVSFSRIFWELFGVQVPLSKWEFLTPGAATLVVLSLLVGLVILLIRVPKDGTITFLKEAIRAKKSKVCPLVTIR